MPNIMLLYYQRMMNQSQLLMAPSYPRAWHLVPLCIDIIKIPQLPTQPCFFHPRPNTSGDGFRAEHDAQQQAC